MTAREASHWQPPCVGGVAVWASEVEPYPIAVTKSRFPEMKHLGDISKINGAHIEPVDLITFGSPCQDLSVAGKRVGLKHEANGDEETTRSGLFMEAVRIIKEMREATHGNYPRFALWENVPGAFSSNKGEDFRIVLEELIKIVEPGAAMPSVPKKGWAYADSYVGDGWSLAYRVFDAQYWGVPQRRRRIYLVLDLGGERAQEILFEREGLRGNFAQGKPPWQGAAADVEGGAGAADREGTGELVCMATQQGGAEIRMDDKAPTVTAAAGMSGNNQPFIAYSAGFKAGQGVNARGIGWEEEQTPTLASENGGNSVPSVCYMERGVFRKGTRPHNVEEAQKWEEARISNTLNTFDYGESRANELVVEKAPVSSMVSVYESHPIDSRIRELDAVAPTVTVKFAKGTADTPLVCSELRRETKPDDGSVICIGNGQTNQSFAPELAGALNCMHDQQAVVYGVNCRHGVEYQELYQTLMAKPNGGQSLNYSGAVRVDYIVRRLTPTECARLQGFPDEWGHIDHKDRFTPEELSFWQEVRNSHASINSKLVKDNTEKQMLSWYNKLHTDSAEYKMWGNGLALPTALYCMQGIAEVFDERQ